MEALAAGTFYIFLSFAVLLLPTKVLFKSNIQVWCIITQSGF